MTFLHQPGTRSRSRSRSQTTSHMVYILLLLNYLNSQALLLPLSGLSELLSNQRTIHQSLKLPKLRRYLNEADANNYRPISLLSNFNRIFEKIMYKRMTSYIEKHNLLYTSQYGFRKGHSTQHAILDIIINDIQTNMNQRLLSCGVFIDLKKSLRHS